VAVVVDGTHALAYVCDGVPANPTGTVLSIQAWFNGPSDGKTMDLRRPPVDCSFASPTQR
jgi:hypothetical protein